MRGSRKTLAGAVIAFAVFNAFGGAAFAAGARPILRGDPAEFATAFQLNPGHTGSITFSAPFQAPLKKLWGRSISTSFSGPNYPVIADGLVFVSAITDSKSTVYALDLTTGATVWSKQVQSSTPSLTYENGTLFAQTLGGLLTAYESTTGNQRWQIQLPLAEEFPSDPIAANGIIYSAGGVDGGYLFATNEQDGSRAWALQGLDGGESTPAFGAKGVYVAFPCQYYKFDPGKGKLKWHVNNFCSGGGSVTPVVFGKNVYIADNDKGDFVLDAKNGNLIDTFPGLVGPTLFTNAKGIDFGVTLTAEGLTCWRLSTGGVAWKYADSGHNFSDTIVVNDLVFASSRLGTLYALDTKKGKVKWSTNTGLVLNYLAAGQGTLIAVGSDSIQAYVPQ